MSNLNFSIEDVDFLYDLKSKSSYFRTEDILGRFNLVREADRTFEMVISEPDFDEGSILWFEAQSSALLCYRILESLGYDSYLAYDNHHDSYSYIVLSTIPYSINQPDPNSVDFYSILIPFETEEEHSSIMESFRRIEDSRNIKFVFEKIKAEKVFDLKSDNGLFILRGDTEISWSELEELQKFLSKELSKNVGISKFK